MLPPLVLLQAVLLCLQLTFLQHNVLQRQEGFLVWLIYAGTHLLHKGLILLLRLWGAGPWQCILWVLLDCMA